MARFSSGLGHGPQAGDRHGTGAARQQPAERALREGAPVGGERRADLVDPGRPAWRRPAVGEPFQPLRCPSAHVVRPDRPGRPGEQPHRQWPTVEAGQVVLVADRQHRRVVAQHRLVVLDRGAVRAGGRERLRRGLVVGAPAVRPDLALVDQGLQGVDQVERGGHRQCVDVQLVEVDVVGAEPAERVFQAAHRERRAGVGAERPPGALLADVAELGGDHHAVPSPGHRLTEDPLAVPGAVVAGGVEQGHPEIERPVDGADRFVVVHLTPAERLPVVAPERAADGPAPHSDRAHRDAAASQRPCRRHGHQPPTWSALQVKHYHLAT